MSIAIGLVTGLQLDVGLTSTKATDLAGPLPVGSTAEYVTSIPSLGTIIDPTKASGLLERIFPGLASFCPIIVGLAFMIVMFLSATKLIVAMGGPFTRSEDPGSIAVRTVLAGVGVAASYTIFVLIETLFNSFYGLFRKNYLSLTKDAANYTLLFKTDEAEGTAATTSGAEGAFQMNGKDLIEDYPAGTGLALTILEVALFTILLITFLKLLVEVYERYVVLGVLFYFSPLAYATMVSKESSVFGNYIQMVISEIIVMMSNLFFTGCFISGWLKILKTEDHALFADPKEFIVTMLIMIAWLLMGQKFDQHLKSLGLSTAQTGAGLGGAVMAGAAGVGAAASLAGSVLGFAGKAATGQTGVQKAISAGEKGGVVGKVANAISPYPNLSQTQGLRKMQNMDGKERGFLSTLNAATGGNLDSSLKSAYGGRGMSDINQSTLERDKETGRISGKFNDGSSFEMYEGSKGGNTNGYATMSVGNGEYSMAISEGAATSMAAREAKAASGKFKTDGIEYNLEYRANIESGKLEAYEKVPVKDGSTNEVIGSKLERVNGFDKDITGFNGNRFI